jgi:hypothetical protein
MSQSNPYPFCQTSILFLMCVLCFSASGRPSQINITLTYKAASPAASPAASLVSNSFHSFFGLPSGFSQEIFFRVFTHPSQLVHHLGCFFIFNNLASLQTHLSFSHSFIPLASASKQVQPHLYHLKGSLVRCIPFSYISKSPSTLCHFPGFPFLGKDHFKFPPWQDFPSTKIL